MLIIAHHFINDPEAFWSVAKNVGSLMPADLKLHSVFPSKDLKTGTCVWEAGTVEEVQKFLDDNVGTSAKNVCYQVDVANAVGVPEMVATATAIA